MGEKIGEGIGKTRREAQRQAAEGSIKNLASTESFFFYYYMFNTIFCCIVYVVPYFVVCLNLAFRYCLQDNLQSFGVLTVLLFI